MTQQSIHRLRVNRLLVIAPNWVGDAVMTQPLLRLLKAERGVSHITVFASQAVAAVYEMMPEVDAVIAHPLPHGGIQWRARWRYAQQLKALQFNACVVLPNSLKSALIPWLARIPYRWGYVGEWRYGVLTHPIDKLKSTVLISTNTAHTDPTQRVSMLAWYAQLAWYPQQHEATVIPSIQQITAQAGEPRLQVADDDIAAACEAFNLPKNHYIALCPGAEYGKAKRWPTSHFGALAQQLQQQYPAYPIIILGSPKDVTLGTEITAIAPQAINLCGKTSLKQAMALIAGAAYLVANDSGLMHIAAALQRPQIAIFGSSDPRHTPPLSSVAHIEWLHLPCSPCFKRSCPLGHMNCLQQIVPESIATVLMTHLATPPTELLHEE